MSQAQLKENVPLHSSLSTLRLVGLAWLVTFPAGERSVIESCPFHHKPLHTTLASPNFIDKKRCGILKHPRKKSNLPPSNQAIFQSTPAPGIRFGILLSTRASEKPRQYRDRTWDTSNIPMGLLRLPSPSKPALPSASSDS